MQIVPHLNFNGECEAAFRYYERFLGGKIEIMMPHEGTPAAEHVGAEWAKKIIHARMKIGDTSLMGADAPPGRYTKPAGFTVSAQTKTPEEADRAFLALADGGRCRCRSARPSSRSASAWSPTGSGFPGW